LEVTYSDLVEIRLFHPKSHFETMSVELSWIEKYRPSTLDDVSSHKQIIKTLKKFMESKTLPHMCFYGPPGTGKTSTCVALARELYGAHYRRMVLELNASDARGIQVVRTRIKDFASTCAFDVGGVKMIILDEADAMTSEAQLALRRIMELYSDNARFCIICNYLTKIIDPLQSRCTKFKFSALESKHIKQRIDFISREEGVDLEKGVKTVLVKECGGDMRSIVNTLQAATTTTTSISKDLIYEVLGKVKPSMIHEFWDDLLEKTLDENMEWIERARREGLSIHSFVEALAPVVIATRDATHIKHLATIEDYLSRDSIGIHYWRPLLSMRLVAMRRVDRR
jgi:replication factor C subunit 3/5